MTQSLYTFIVQFAVSFWQTAGEMAPYLLFGFFAAAVSVAIVRPDFIERHLGRGRRFSVPKAALAGVPLPLCSCSVIPVAASLRRGGASRGATIAFLVSTPQTGIDSIFVTYSLLGPIFTILRPVAALVSGLAGGYLVDRLTAGEKDEYAAPPSPPDEKCCCERKPANRITGALRYAFIDLPRDISSALLIGLSVSALISVLLPENFLGNLLGTGMLPMLVMMAVSIPMYVCASASVPVAAALIMQGITPGAAFVFLMAGPATNAATLATVWKILGRKTAVLYLLVVAVFALVFGWLLDYTCNLGGFSQQHWQHGHHGLPEWLKTISAIVLFLLLGLTRLKLPFLYTEKSKP